MFRVFFSRVVVVSVVAFSLNIAVVPAAQARVQPSSRPAPTVDQGCVEKAMGWINQVLGKELRSTRKDRKKKMTGNDGCTIDPFGNPKCP